MSRPRKDWSTMVKEYETKALTTGQLTKKYGISRQRIHQILKDYGVKSHTSTCRKISPHDEELVVQAYKQLGSAARVSRKFKVSAYQVTKVLQKQNVIPVVSEYDDQDVKDWNERYECGETMSSIARAYGVKVSDVSKNITSKGSLKQEFRQAVKAKVLELYKDGKTVTDSAVGAGCSAPTARKYVREAGLMRPAKKTRVVQIAEDHSAGMSLQELSTKYRVSEKLLPNLIAAANRSL